MIQGLEELPFVIWPKFNGDYKFIQLEVDSKPFLRFEHDCARIHASILRHFLHELSISPSSITGLCGISCPAPEGERYRVFGMGKAEIKLEYKRAFFSGASRDYGIRPSKEFFDRYKLLIPDWNLVY